jgi:hypothetical protein
MARKDRLVICATCGEVNPAENVSCKSCLGDLSGKAGGHAGQSQLAQLHRLVKRVEVTNSRINFLIGSIWLIFALYVGWAVVAGIMGVGGPSSLFRWPF